MADASRVVDIVLQVVGKGHSVIKSYADGFSNMESAGRSLASGVQTASKSLGNLESNLAKVQGFTKLKQNAQETASALTKTQKGVAELARQIKDKGNFGQELQRGLDAAHTSVSQFDEALARQRGNLDQIKTVVGRLTEEYKQAGQELKQLQANRNADTASLDRAKAKYASLGTALSGARRAQRDIAATIKETKTAYSEAGQSVSDYKQKIKENAEALDANRQAFEQAKATAASLKGVYNDQQQALHRLRQSLAAAGISTKNLATSQRQLQAEYEKTQQVTQARDFLGLKSHKDIRAEIVRVQQAYQTLARSGQLSGKELAQAMQTAKQRIRELHSQTESLNERVSQIGASWQQVVAAMAALGLLAAGLRQFGEFESSMLKVQALTSATGQNFENLNQTALHLGATTRYTASEAAAGMGELAAAGLNAKQILETIPSALHIAAASGMEVAEAADKITNIFTQFGGAANNTVEHVADVMTAGFTGAATSLQQLSEAMVYCGPVANALGYSIEDTTALLMALANGGFKASMAGTALRGAMVRLVNPTEEAQAILDKCGVTVRNTDGTMRDFDKIIDELKQGGIDGAEAMELFGLRAGPAMQTLLGQGGQAVREMGEKLADVDGRAREIADHMESGFMGSMRRLWAGISAVAIAFGQTVGPSIAVVADALATLLTSISKLPGPLKTVASILTVVGAGFLLWKSGLGSLVKATVALPKLILEMRAARVSAAELNAELAKVGPVATASMGKAGLAATTLSGTLKGTAASAGTAAAGMGKLAGALSGLFNIGMAFAGGWFVGDMLNNFDLVRKSGASLIYAFDRVMLAAKRMWAFISGGDTKAVDREIEAAKEAYEGLLKDIEKGQDDWSKKQRGEKTTSEVLKEARLNRAREEQGEDKSGGEKKRKAPGELSQDILDEEFGQSNWDAKAAARKDRLAEIDEELADRRSQREERAFDEELARQEKLAAIRHKQRADENVWDERLEREKELPENTKELDRQKELHEQRMAQLAQERRAAEQQGNEQTLEDIGEQEKRETEAHEDEIARLEHEQRLQYIQLEEEAAKAAHENTLARIQAEAEARRAAHQQQLEDIKAEREEIEEAHEEKMKLLAEELEAAKKEGDKRAIHEAEKNITRAEKDYEKETARLDKIERKAAEVEAKAKQADERKKQDEELAYAREQGKLKIKLDKENRAEEARQRERYRAQQAAEAEEAQRKAVEAAERQAEAEAQAKEEAEAEAQDRAEAEAREQERLERQREAEAERRRRKAERKGRAGRLSGQTEERQEKTEEKTAEALDKGKEAFAKAESAAKQMAEAQQALEESARAAEEAARATEEQARAWAESQKQAAEEAASAVKDYYQRLKDASEEVADRQKSLSEELLELDTTKTEKQKWQILAKQAADYEKQAKAAMKAGDLDKAKELADLARSSYSRLKGGAEGIDRQQTNRQVYSGVKSAGELGIAIAKLQEQQAAKATRQQVNVANVLARNLGPAVQQMQQMAGNQQAQPRTQGAGQQVPVKEHVLKFTGGSLRGSEADVEALLRQLEQAGLTA